MSNGKSLKSGLVAYVLADPTVSGLISNRLYAKRASQNNPAPYIVWSTVSADETAAHDGPTGLEEFRIQFSIYAETISDSESVRDALKDRINGFSGSMGLVTVGSCFFKNEIDLHDDTVGLKHKVVDFNISLNA